MIKNTGKPQVTIGGRKIWNISGDIPETNPVLRLTRTTTVDGVTSDPEIVLDDQGNPLQPEWIREDGTLTYRYSGLAKSDDNDHDYTYNVSEASFVINNKTYTVEKEDDGFVVKENGSIVNTFEVTQSGYDITNTEKKEFSFIKEWYGIDSSQPVVWPKNGDKDIPIKVTITGRKEGSPDTITVCTDLELTSEEPGEEAIYSLSKEGNSYKFTFDNLDKDYAYTVSEATIDGYHIEYYLRGSSTKQNSGIEWTDDGGIIKNINTTYSLPESGGFGTTPFYTIGLLLIAFAAGLYTYFNKKKLITIRSDRRSSGTGRGKKPWRGGDGL